MIPTAKERRFKGVINMVMNQIMRIGEIDINIFQSEVDNDIVIEITEESGESRELEGLRLEITGKSVNIMPFQE